MRVIFLAILIMLTGGSLARADQVQVEAFVTTSKDDTPRSAMPSTTARVYVIYKTKGVKAGDKFRAVLVSDHANQIASENGKIIEANVILDGDTEAGALSFSKPTNDWPVGDYHVEIYINGSLAATARFNIQSAP